MRRVRWGVGVVAAVGLLLAVAGIATALRTRASSYGWFAYAPLSSNGQVPHMVTDGELFTWGVGIIGLLICASAAGYVFAVRRARPRKPLTTPTESAD